MNSYSLYLFDFDGTLFDTLDSLKEAYRLSFLKYGINCKDEEYDIFLGLSLPLTAKYKGLDEKYVQEFIDYFHNLVHTDEVVKNTKLYFDTIDTINYLNKNNIQYGIVTGSSTYRVKSVFEHFGFDYSKLKVCIGNDCYSKPKPDPEPILNALKKVNYLDKKDKVLFIGDGPQDIECSKNAGIDCIIVKRNGKCGDIDTLLDIYK